MYVTGIKRVADDLGKPLLKEECRCYNMNTVNCTKGAWVVKVIKPFEKNLYQIPEGIELRVKDKFPDDNGDCEKGVWQIKSHNGDLFYMSYDERLEFLKCM